MIFISKHLYEADTPGNIFIFLLPVLQRESLSFRDVLEMLNT